MAQLICPICRGHLRLIDTAKMWRCEQNHSFDVARQGYVNLLPVQHKNSLHPGDTADSVAARRAFLQAGFYQPLRDHVAQCLAEWQVQSLLDLGCGEGYYTQAMAQAMQAALADVVGLDIAKPAIQHAAKQFKQITWVVGSGALLPLADASVDVVSSLFSPLPVAEMARVLKQDGRLIVATPAPDHLLSLRQGLFDEVRLHEPDKFIDHVATHFSLQQQHEIRVPLQLTGADVRNLLAMTPYAWKARADKRAALEAHEQFASEAVFRVMVFGRKTA